MKNTEVLYPTKGSSALKTDCLDNVIEFPGQSDAVYEIDRIKSNSRSKGSLRNMIFNNKFVLVLRHGSIKGKAFNLAKPWQSWLAGSCFLAFALTCVYLTH